MLPSIKCGISCQTFRIIRNGILLSGICRTVILISNKGTISEYSRKQVVTDSKYNPLASQVPQAGAYMQLTCHIPPTKDTKSAKRIVKPKEFIQDIDPGQHRMVWEFASLPRWLMHCQRVQTLTTILDEEDRAIILYTSEEVFGGPLAYLIKWFLTPSVIKHCFDIMGRELKSRAEESWILAFQQCQRCNLIV